MKKEKLYRKVNTRARGVHHLFGGEYRNVRNGKGAHELDAERGSMHGGHRRGLDYTPLFRFLISKVGSVWDEVFSEAVGRLDRHEPVSWIVSIGENTRKDIIRVGESSYFSGLFVDKDGKLQFVDPKLTADAMEPSCACCTHTFNGKKFGRPYPGSPIRVEK